MKGCDPFFNCAAGSLCLEGTVLDDVAVSRRNGSKCRRSQDRLTLKARNAVLIQTGIPGGQGRGPPCARCGGWTKYEGPGLPESP